MTQKPKSYLLICLLISSGLLFAVNFHVDFAITRYYGYIKIASGFFLILTIIAAVFYSVKRTWKTFRSSLIIASVFFLLNSILVAEIIALEMHSANLYKMERQLETCEKAENQFKVDFENDDLKYFTFGIVEDEAFTTKLEKEYNLEVYHVGCIVYASYECYNTKIEKELKILE